MAKASPRHLRPGLPRHQITLMTSKSTSEAVDDPQPTSTAAKLPPELLMKLFRSAREMRRYDEVECEREYRNVLLAASLVCRSWKRPAQAVLWERLSFKSKLDLVRLWKSSSFGVYWTADLTLVGQMGRRTQRTNLGGVSGSMPRKIVSQLDGLRHLKLQNIEVASTVLLSPSLSGVSDIQLDNVRFNDTKGVANTARIGSHLTSLQLSVRHELNLDLPLHIFLAPSLTTLDLSIHTNLPHKLLDGLILFVTSIASQLFEFHLRGHASGTFIPPFQLFTSLRILGLPISSNYSLTQRLDKFPSQLSELHIYGFGIDPFFQITSVLPMPCLAKLCALHMPAYNEYEVQSTGSGRQLYKELRVRSIALVLGHRTMQWDVQWDGGGE